MMILLVPSLEFRGALLREGPHGSRPPIYRDLVPLPVGLVAPEGESCSECPDPGLEEWQPAQRDCLGVCRIRRDSLCVKAARPGALGQRSSLVLGAAGLSVLEGCDRAKRVLAAREGRPSLEVPTFYRSGNGDAWILWTQGVNDGPLYYGIGSGPVVGMPQNTPRITALATPPTLPPGLLTPWALATTCAFRGLGSVIVIQA